MTDFAYTLQEAGYIPPPIIRDDGRFQRFGPKLAHWLVFDGVFGAAGDWRGQNPRVRWKPDGNSFFSFTEKKRLREQAKAAFQEYQSDREQRAQETAEQAAAIWNACKNDGKSAYLARKKVPAFGCRYGVEVKTNRPFLAVPGRDSDGALWNLQKIYADGAKFFLKGGRKQGCFHMLGNVADSDVIYFCEGYATAASVHMATGKAVAICFDAGNLDPVIQSFRRTYPSKRFIIAADDDARNTINTGKIEAEKAGTKYGCAVALPRFHDESTDGSDFNDLHVTEGLEKVRKQLNVVATAPVLATPNIWPEPDMSLVDADQAMPPAFDPAFLPSPWSEWVFAQAEAVGCPVDYVAAALLASASAWIGNSRRIAATADWVEPPHLWFALIGIPSTGKTPAQRPFIDACKLLEMDERPAWQERMHC